MAAHETKRRQISLKWLLAVVLLCGIGFMIYREFIYQPPWYSNASYEKAKAFYGRTAPIGANEIRIESIVRNDRDGTLHFDQPESAPRNSRATLASAGPWLDVVEIQLTPGDDLVEIIEMRVFDHASGALLRNISSGYGHHVSMSNLVQIHGINRLLPPTLDLWFRVRSHENNLVSTLPISKGATVQIEDATVEMVDFQSGFDGWSSKEGINPVDGEFHGDSVFELHRTGDLGTTPIQITAIYAHNRKYFPAQQLLVSLDAVILPIPLDQVNHFELRRNPGTEKFFFSRLHLPPLQPRSSNFSAPPTAIVAIDGTPQDKPIPEFQPLDVRVSVLDGDVFSGGFSSNVYSGFIPKRNGPTEQGTMMTVVITPTTNVKLRYSLDYQSITSGLWNTRFLQRTRSSFNAGGLESHSYKRPLDDLKTIKIKLIPPP